MTQTIAADKITLYDLEQQFQLQQSFAPDFFPEWQRGLPALTTAEQERLQRVKAIAANLERRSVLENTVKLAIVAPLLDLAGLFLPPFYVSTEDAVEIEAIDGDLAVRGRIDILVIKERLWVLVIESKRAEFSLKVGIPQVLSDMLAAPTQDLPLYGLVTNGTDFLFTKLLRQKTPYYAKSKQFVLGQNDDLEQVLQILKRLAALVV
ncbi:restriction endonuclease subunit R [Nodosilinea sp. P-1105]|uniref:restriction endonuclease subunit R n=1 Tax=Nodosilinea sp. P-1105 TaxID=2546229 RepID=UPI001469F3DE|nr:restriction endonuclease subunit R [Nodosilinea sp. P-1105]